MAGFNFGQIGPIIGRYMDTDLIDIGREEPIKLPDGSKTVTDEKIPKWPNVPCNVSPNQTPNPDPVTAGTMPITVSLTINCSVDIDLQNSDWVTIRKMSHDGQELEGYEGRIGVPITSQGRKEAILVARQSI